MRVVISSLGQERRIIKEERILPKLNKGWRMSILDRTHFWIISLVHWNLFSLFVNPYAVLGEAGLKQGQKVLEVGCGPGFFTLAAAKIVGEKGRVYALDVNPLAIETTRHRIEEQGLTNVETLLADACETGAPDQSIDIVFLFGVLHAIDDMDAVMQEMHRVLKTEGILAIQKPQPWSEKKLLETITREALFLFEEKTDNIFKFVKVV